MNNTEDTSTTRDTQSNPPETAMLAAGETKGKVSNVLVWILAFIPWIGAFFRFGTLAFLAANILLCIFDEKNLKKAGYDTEQLGSAWLIPVYLYKRANYLGDNLAYFIVWCVSFGLSFLGFL